MVPGPDSLPPSPLESGTAGSAFWLERIKHQGISAFNVAPSSYQVFRNVKDFRARGDGTTDDTNAIKCVFFSQIQYYFTNICHSRAISSGGRRGGGNCGSSTFVLTLI
jgi:glucan 1,3-beta-glucosidase